MTERTWSVRLSISDLNASIFLLETDAEVAAWARGLMRGLNAGEAKEGASSSYFSGWEIGAIARAKADSIRAGLAENGRAGGLAKSGKRLATANAIATADATADALPFALAEQRTKNKEQRIKEQRARRAAFSPSMFDHMIPESLSTFADFVESWHGWMSSRHDRKKPISEAAAKTQLEDLAGFGRVGAVLSIRQSIAHDWQGVFAPKTQGVQSQPVRAPATPATQPTLKPAWVE